MKDRFEEHLNFEEDYSRRFAHENKKERKQAQATDRSKYKKTDRDQQKKEAQEIRKDLLRGLVLSIHSQEAIVQHEERQFTCTLRGALKQEKKRQRNLITVGDWVRFARIGDKEGVIEQIEPRQTFLSRGDPLSQQQEHIIAANVEQVIITTSVVNPLLRPSIIDRYIIAARKGNMRPYIVVNKIDLLEEKEHDKEICQQQIELLSSCIRAYSDAGIPLLSISAKTGEGLDLLREAMDRHISVFSGQSGVGKTELINATTGRDLRTQKTVAITRKGSHTTTRSKLLPLQGGGWCVDTPGIKSFGLWELHPNEIEAYFEEIHQLQQHCQFSNCTHTHENNCAVKKALQEGILTPLRYESYVALMDSIHKTHRRR